MPDQKYSDNRSYPAIPFFEVDDGDGVKMEPLDYWRLCDELSVVQAALLIVGVDPSEFMNRVEYMGLETRPEGYEAAKAAICGALRCNNVTGKIARIHNSKTFRSEYIEDEDSINLEKTRLQVGSLKTWLAARGIKTGFFFAEGSEFQTIWTRVIRGMRPNLQQLCWRGRQPGTKPHSRANLPNKPLSNGFGNMLRTLP